MGRTALIAFLVLGGLTVGALAVTAQAQIAPQPVDPSPCYVGEYDLNGDKRVDILDFNMWKMGVQRSTTECQLGAEAGKCPAGFDINGDGFVTLDDLNEMVQHYKTCIRVPRNTDPSR